MSNKNRINAEHLSQGCIFRDLQRAFLTVNEHFQAVAFTLSYLIKSIYTKSLMFISPIKLRSFKAAT